MTTSLERLKDCADHGWYAFPSSMEGAVLAYTVNRWRTAILSTARSTAQLLELPDPENSLALVRRIREKALDISILARWREPEDAAMRILIHQRLRFVPRTAADKASHTEALRNLKRTWPALYSELARLGRRTHWSGLGIDQRIAMAEWPSQVVDKDWELLCQQVHASTDLLDRRWREPVPDHDRTASGLIHYESVETGNLYAINEAALVQQIAELAAAHVLVALHDLDRRFGTDGPPAA